MSNARTEDRLWGTASECVLAHAVANAANATHKTTVPAVLVLLCFDAHLLAEQPFLAPCTQRV